MSDTANMATDIVLEMRGVARHYDDLKILDQADFKIRPGELVALLGPSGSGKSSLLHIAGLLEKPTAGQVLFGGKATDSMSDRERTRLRRERIGFVYQAHHLLPEFNALQNVMVPQLIAGVSRKKAAIRAEKLLENIGLADRVTHQPAELSGGEKQRVAIARALANNPALLLADEPTGNLDQATSDKVFDGLVALAKGSGLSALIATHDQNLASRMDRVVGIKNRELITL